MKTIPLDTVLMEYHSEGLSAVRDIWNHFSNDISVEEFIEALIKASGIQEKQRTEEFCDEQTRLGDPDWKMNPDEENSACQTSPIPLKNS